MKQYLLLFLLFSFLERCDATRCFDCQNIPYPRACAKLTVCNSDEYCFTEQFVTSSGNILYNTGCMHNQRCFAFRDKRSSNISRRSTDISTCIECCQGDFCNNKGCGTKAVPADQRGPYCFHCDSVLDPKACTNVATCLQNEICMLHSPADFVGLPEIVYKSACGRQSDCEKLSQTVSSNRCSPTCCETDFCNDQCGISLHNNKTSPIPTMPTTGQPDTITTHPSTEPTSHTQGVLTSTTETPRSPPTSSSVPPTHCDTHGGYIHLHSSKEDLCVHIVNHHADWDEARAACKKEGGDLVVLDTHTKATLLRNHLAHHYDHQAYWIGAISSHEYDFSWVNHSPLTHSVSDWDPGQPNDGHGHNQICACMYRNSDSHTNNFKWHDKTCSYECNYICER
ncbi:uncharacterized protein LOC123532900 [Mercenaria mercenaria]|uniref:uncharacterized protein LOC123532900 n=1 Tax=Mercenaria mercenaria TaxID=6596 RepID=UPI00234E862D|nr:uncharacterized protein LOC123532900 [Mercenaria mercenaria]